MKRDIDDVERARRLIAACEKSLGYKLSEGSKGDLLADNNNDWPLDYIKHILQELRNA